MNTGQPRIRICQRNRTKIAQRQRRRGNDWKTTQENEERKEEKEEDRAMAGEKGAKRQGRDLREQRDEAGGMS
eukprot:753733-Hanusia_phi.AAC.2